MSLMHLIVPNQNTEFITEFMMFMPTERDRPISGSHIWSDPGLVKQMDLNIKYDLIKFNLI